MRYWFGLLLMQMLVLPPTLYAQSSAGLISIPSTHDVATTESKLKAALQSKGMQIFAQIDHAAAAKQIKQTLHPTRLIIFGNPKIGTKLMQCDQRMGIELPLKMLIYEDETGKVWLSYANTQVFAQRYRLEACSGVLEKVSRALTGFAQSATE